MRILILGGSGMVGHRLWLAARDGYETWTTIRGYLAGQPWAPMFEVGRVVENVRADDAPSLDRAFDVARPDVVINALGLIKQRATNDSPGESYLANSFVPHYVRRLCDVNGARLIHISTDCVF